MATKEKKPKNTGVKLSGAVQSRGVKVSRPISRIKKKKTVADVMRQLNGLLDFETGQEALDDFHKNDSLRV